MNIQKKNFSSTAERRVFKYVGELIELASVNKDKMKVFNNVLLINLGEGGKLAKAIRNMLDKRDRLWAITRKKYGKIVLAKLKDDEERQAFSELTQAKSNVKTILYNSLSAARDLQDLLALVR